ncbi:TPA: hypothetical protein I7108_001300 [Vibrio cholerae O1]|nr:hypothetical protein [Vibrio cholerae]EGQ8140674.1 hypothetical protein [Vibrio cholerae]BER95230.1 hypothetical protein VNVC001_15510 [Vibrio cholerae]HAS6014936.1 hypothetical protein [Vibrio cholerae O1]
MFRQTEANKLVAESAQETNAIEVSDGNRGKTVGKKYRGIAGGTIPRVSTTPSLAAGVV